MSERPLTSATILGCGSFGIAVAKLLTPKLESIRFVARDSATVEAINTTRRNPHYLHSA
jgi:glycerol-3-phosphate dehydrogenase